MLNVESGYTKLVEYYEENKNSPWKEWLAVEKIFSKGKQGIAGLMKSTKTEKPLYFVFKISQYINYLVQHELSVMSSLVDVADYCPHFCRPVGTIVCNIDPANKDDPFAESGNVKYLLEKDVLLMEYIENSYKFYNYIYSDKVSEDVLYSVVKQTLLAVSIAQKKRSFTHYDLHSNNIMVKKCSSKLVMLYILDENNQFCVPTRGYYPVIIDYGFSYSDGLKGGPLWPSMCHTDIGFTSDRYDPYTDAKLFLVTVSDEIQESRRSRKSRRLLNITKNLYKDLHMDWDSGWDNMTKKSATDVVLDDLDINRKSRLFKKYDIHCMDILQSLVILPLEKRSYEDLQLAFNMFLEEFVKIEREIGSPFFCIYIMKNLVDAVRVVRRDYQHNSTKEVAIKYFTGILYDVIDSVSTFCRPKIKAEKMLCALICLGRNLDGKLFSVLEKRISAKYKDYEKLPIKITEEIVAAIDINIPEEYVFNENTIIMAVNACTNTCYPVFLTMEEKARLNTIASISWGGEIYKMTKNKNT